MKDFDTLLHLVGFFFYALYYNARIHEHQVYKLGKIVHVAESRG